MADWYKISSRLWDAVLTEVRALKGSGYTLDQIAKQAGLNNKSVVSQWLSGDRKAENTSFALLMTYVENLGLNYREYFPDWGKSNDHEAANYFYKENKECRDRLAIVEDLLKKAKKENEELIAYKHKWEGYLEVVRAGSAAFERQSTMKKIG